MTLIPSCWHHRSLALFVAGFFAVLWLARPGWLEVYHPTLHQQTKIVKDHVPRLDRPGGDTKTD